MTDEELLQQFIGQIIEAVWDCEDNDSKRRISVGTQSGKTIVIDIYPQGSTLKSFDSIVLNAVKKSKGIKVHDGEKK